MDGITVLEMVAICSNSLAQISNYSGEVNEELDKVSLIISDIIERAITDQEGYDEFPSDTTINPETLEVIRRKLEEFEKEDNLYENFARLLSPEENKILEGINKADEEGGNDLIRKYLNDNKIKKLIRKLDERSILLELIIMLGVGKGNKMTIIVDFLLKKHNVVLENLRNKDVQRFMDSFKSALSSLIPSGEDVCDNMVLN